ncbi:unnamed protein product [Symbiodinium natans]|uniref:Uncharacterized protein n=1 Tax=Symbiodinium natans TaxID=878477 RepID=A0A812UTN5_9DINO|nr:unnamed protein product [Symbiodinium natans]
MAKGLHRAAWFCLWLGFATCQPSCQEVDSLVLEVEEGDASESDVQQLLSCRLDCQILIPLGCSLSENQTLPLLRQAATSLSCSNYENLTETSLELWLNCGGDIHWEDAAGNPLLDLLRNREARKFWNQQATIEAAVAHTVSDWRAWVIPISAAFLAFLEVCAERYGFRRCKDQEAPGSEAKEDPFLEGAKLLVSAAFRKHNILVSLWRFLEVSTCIFWFALVLLIVHWGWWIPVAGMMYLLPAFRIYGWKEVMKAPTLAMVAALLRTSALFGIFSFIYGGLYWKVLIPDYMIDRFSFLINPLVISWSKQKENMLQNSILNEHWLFFWAPDINALQIFRTFREIAICLVVLYWACLLIAVLRHFICRCCSGDDPKKALRHELEHAVQELLQKQPEDFGEVDKRIKPVKAFLCPWHGTGLYQSVALQLLDIALHINTSLRFILEGEYWFAAVMIFVVTRSIVKQFFILPAWQFRKALKASVSRGLLRRDVLDFLEEQKRSEALFCGCFTAYSLFFAINSAGDMLVQYVSLLSSMWQFAGYAMELCNLDFKVEAVLPQTTTSPHPPADLPKNMDQLGGDEINADVEDVQLANQKIHQEV